MGRWRAVALARSGGTDAGVDASPPDASSDAGFEARPGDQKDLDAGGAVTLDDQVFRTPPSALRSEIPSNDAGNLYASLHENVFAAPHSCSSKSRRCSFQYYPHDLSFPVPGTPSIQPSKWASTTRIRAPRNKSGSTTCSSKRVSDLREESEIARRVTSGRRSEAGRRHVRMASASTTIFAGGIVEGSG
jgi:hypothetical protein